MHIPNFWKLKPKPGRPHLIVPNLVLSLNNAALRFKRVELQSLVPCE
jgi:hypothetical protein